METGCADCLSFLPPTNQNNSHLDSYDSAFIFWLFFHRQIRPKYDISKPPVCMLLTNRLTTTALHPKPDLTGWLQIANTRSIWLESRPATSILFSSVAFLSRKPCCSFPLSARKFIAEPECGTHEEGVDLFSRSSVSSRDSENSVGTKNCSVVCQNPLHFS